MIIVADQNIPLAEEALTQFGEVRLAPGRTLTRDHLAGADALVVRSVTKVNRELLEGTTVRFVGTATIGTDHVDQAFLAEKGIAFVNAAGCNARSVVEWVLAALAEYCVEHGLDWEGKSIGIIGHGNIGGRLAVRGRGLGLMVWVNDPPLARKDEHLGFRDLDFVLKRCDFVTLHVPLTHDGDDPTYHLINAEKLALMKPGALLINASRGPVLDNAAALEARNVNYILDVFENEPRADQDLVRRAFLATPHIAGYSYEGKVNGTLMMAQALGHFLGRTSRWMPKLPPPSGNMFKLENTKSMEATLEAIRQSYPIREDDARLREGLGLGEEEWGTHFDALRKNYPQRREFANFKLAEKPKNPNLQRRMAVLHFL